MLKHLKKRLNFEALKEDACKLGTNLVTAGLIGLFITYIADTSLLTKIGSIVMIIIGGLATGFGLYGQDK